MDYINLIEYLPFLIPLAILQLGLLIAALYSIFKSNSYKWGNRTIWIIISFLGILGPIIYFVFGKEE